MIQTINDIEFELIRRRVKYLRIQVLPLNGAVKVISPNHLDNAVINEFIVKRSAWINKHRTKFKAQKDLTNLSHISGETHLLWGKSYTLQVYDSPGTAAHVSMADGDELQLWINADNNDRAKLIDQFYRAELNQLISILMAKWESIIQVQSSSFYIRKMKTRWGSCNVISKRIAFNLELAKKPVQCLEYIVVHELVHLLEPSHNARFKNFMDQFLPDWRERKKLLNS